MKVDVDIRGLIPARKQIELLKLPAAKRARILRKTANKVARDSRKRITAQKDLQGKPYPKRWKPRKDRRKMEGGLKSLMRIKRVDETEAVIGFPGLAGVIAAKQQEGSAAEPVRIRRLGDRKNNGQYWPCSREQASELLEIGFKIRKKGKGYKTPSMRWILNNLESGQAGTILRILRENAGWNRKTNTYLPARSFLGATDAEVSEYIGDIVDSILEKR